MSDGSEVYEVEFTIPGEPMGKQRPRATRRGVVYTPSKTKNYESYVRELYAAQGHPFLEGPLRVEIVAQFRMPKTSKKRQQLMLTSKIRPEKNPDIDNICKIILDSLNGIAYPDDKHIIFLKAFKRYSKIPQVVVRMGRLI